jgi:peptide/nickel transport system permease protein
MHPILKLVAQRLALGILLLFAASALIFGLTEILPGDAAQAQLGQTATPENLANLREEMGRPDPIYRMGWWYDDRRYGQRPIQQTANW